MFMIKTSQFQCQNPSLTWMFPLFHIFHKCWYLSVYDTKSSFIRQISKKMCCWSSMFMKSRQFLHSQPCAKAKMLENVVATDNEILFHSDGKSNFHQFHLLTPIPWICPCSPYHRNIYPPDRQFFASIFFTMVMSSVLAS